MSTTTTVLNEDTATIVTDEVAQPQFSWSAVFAGAFVATAVSLLLLTLGSGVGLSLVTVRHATENGAVTFLTLGAIYFLVAQAFGFAAGGHVVGRMIGPALETDREEEFRAGTHGLVAWALAVVATATLIALSVVAGTSATANGAAVGAALSASTPGRSDSATTPLTGYWVDTLFRAPSSNTALLGWKQYAQADNGMATDAPPADSSTITPDQSRDFTPAPARPAPAAPRSGSGTDAVFLNGGVSSTAAAPAPAASTVTTRSLAADKAEAGRILTVGMANGERLSGDDHVQLARLVSNDTGLTLGAAQSRVTDVENRIREDEIKTAETARKTAAYASLWTALALLFGAVVAVAAAISARWEADKEQGVLPGTRVSEVRF